MPRVFDIGGYGRYFQLLHVRQYTKVHFRNAPPGRPECFKLFQLFYAHGGIDIAQRIFIAWPYDLGRGGHGAAAVTVPGCRSHAVGREQAQS